MKNLKKGLLSVSLTLLCSGALYATSCPSVGGYKVLSHDANNTHCSYISYATLKLNLEGQRVAPPKCPRFLLTDNHFSLEGCHHDALRSKCICTIVSQH